MMHTRRFIDLSIAGQLKLMAAPLAMLAAMALACLGIGFLGLGNVATLALGVFAGTAKYFAFGGGKESRTSKHMVLWAVPVESGMEPVSER